MFCFEHVKNEMPIRYPWGNVQQALEYISLEISGEVRTWDRNSAGTSIRLNCKAMKSHEVIQTVLTGKRRGPRAKGKALATPTFIGETVPLNPAMEIEEEPLK